MSSAAALAACRALELRLIALQPALPTGFPNAVFQPPSAAPWQRVTYLLGTPDDRWIGGGFIDSGIFVVSLFYPENKGAAPLMTRAGALRDHFKRGWTGTQGGFSVRIDSTPRFVGGRNEGGWHTIAVYAPYSVEVQS